MKNYKGIDGEKRKISADVVDEILWRRGKNKK